MILVLIVNFGKLKKSNATTTLNNDFDVQLYAIVR